MRFCLFILALSLVGPMAVAQEFRTCHEAQTREEAKQISRSGCYKHLAIPGTYNSETGVACVVVVECQNDDPYCSCYRARR